MVAITVAQIEFLRPSADTEDAIRDLAVEFGLITDYTSMIIVRDEQFSVLGIIRRNRDRVSVERTLREQRQTQQPVSRRVDQNQPTFQKSRPSSGNGNGGGAVGMEVLIFAILTAVIMRRRRRLKV